MLPCLDRLESTPEILRLLLDGLTPEDAVWKPAPDRFSIAEVLEHLSHTEGHCYRPRIERIAEQDNPAIESYDQEIHLQAGNYSGRDAEDSFDHFEEQRETNLEYLRGLPAEAAGRTAQHPEYGAVTLAQILHEWSCHDLGHVRQIAELVRARVHHPHLGPFQPAYQLKP